MTYKNQWSPIFNRLFVLFLIGCVLNEINTQEAKIKGQEGSINSEKQPHKDDTENGKFHETIDRFTGDPEHAAAKDILHAKGILKDTNDAGDKEYILNHNGVEEVNITQGNIHAGEDAKVVDILKGRDDTMKKTDEFRIGNEMVISKNQTVSKLSDKIRKIIEHYQQDDPVGMPDSGIPDPFPVPDVEKSSMVFENMKVHGLSDFRIVKMHTDAPAMEFTLEILFKKLEIKGNYTLSQWWSQSKGRFDVSLLDVTMEGKATLIVNMAGKLEAERINTNARVGSIKLDFENLGMLGSVVQSIMNTAGPFLFDSLKPQLLAEMNIKLLQMTNENLKSLKHHFKPSAGLPIDNLIHSARIAVRDQRFDPYNMPVPYPSNNSMFKVEELVLHGLSNFYRIGDISVHMENKVLQLSLHVGIPLLKGRISWHLLYRLRSTTCFSFKYLQLQISVNQTINDLGRSPSLDRVRVKIGSIKLSKRHSESTIESIVKTMVYGHLPNVLREGILNLLHQPLQVAIQNALDQIKLKDYLSLL